MDSEYAYQGYFNLRLVYRNGRIYEYLEATDSLAILLYVTDTDQVILVRQHRDAMVRPDNPDGEIVELVAGRFDCHLSPVDLAIKECREEVDVDLRPDQVCFLSEGKPMAVSAGSTNERSYLGIGFITSDQISPDRASFGETGTDEQITRLICGRTEVPNEYFQDVRMMAAMASLNLHVFTKLINRKGAVR